MTTVKIYSDLLSYPCRTFTLGGPQCPCKLMNSTLRQQFCRSSGKKIPNTYICNFTPRHLLSLRALQYYELPYVVPLLGGPEGHCKLLYSTILRQEFCRSRGENVPDIYFCIGYAGQYLFSLRPKGRTCA